ncbi:NAD(P)H-binding protein [Desulfopila sp. IMCC35008]|uniref:NAD(P)H-binding protein n=1 Tax=Desulfopila sp. IMCC35008 TaxID=2653858 RepID=UPI0013D4882E|nr:NAD(P)H-binding protein [Desulfopila sp. IMCC35008]
MLGLVFADHETQESYIKESLEWIIVRPAALTDVEYTGSYQHGYSTEGKTVTNIISRADAADFMLKQFSE